MHNHPKMTEFSTVFPSARLEKKLSTGLFTFVKLRLCNLVTLVT
ncbi:hypothetical protein HMPREF0293_0689 [Corynebacterium glucuronolyticum ATCC 51866]|uniref:Uncharacterized protein n=1 Tax=Corynebacterium glucuronolyticum ATCC 51866 TaxID=548478 RepID=A0ABP2DZ29_9CORY|nr:hypothetical protein HMPREF0293_0689 [Corynebacterium glucuronolyticum ATCC 51866]